MLVFPVLVMYMTHVDIANGVHVCVSRTSHCLALSHVVCATCVCVCLCECECACVCVCVCVCVCLSVYIYMYMCVSVSMCVNRYVCAIYIRKCLWCAHEISHCLLG